MRLVVFVLVHFSPAVVAVMAVVALMAVAALMALETVVDA